MRLRILLVAALIWVQQVAFSQIEITESGDAPFTPEQLIYNHFLGDGVKVLSVKYDGPTMSVGTFDKGMSAFGIDKGIIMTTGRVKTLTNGSQILYGIDAIGEKTADNNNGSMVYDKDAASISTEIPQNLVRYTITFQPSSDTLRFRYVFASEEYPEYACRDYNDLFGFFISGPGISGTFENNGINIALIPNTTKSVTINNIHPAYALNKCTAAYEDYYNTNAEKQPVFDGYLDVFTAAIPVIPCQTYTIKLIVADVGDKRLDSGVFLAEKSFGTNALRIEATNPVAVEGCSDGKVTFRLNQAKNTDVTIPIKVIGGTAATNLDYNPLPARVTIPRGNVSQTILLQAKKDNDTEGFENIGLEFEINSCKKDTVWLQIKDNELQAPELGAARQICEGNNVTLDATVNIPQPKVQTFGNTTPLEINTIGVGSTNPPTASEIRVTGVNPSLLRAQSIESVCININHERTEDLDIHLIAPNGKVIELSTDNGGKGKNYKNACFSPKATAKINNGNAPFEGNFLPESNFENLYINDENPINGLWKLQIIDDQVGVKGELIDWKISFKPPYDVTYEWTPDVSLSCKNCAIIKTNPSKSTTYNVIVTDTYQCKVTDSIRINVSNTAPTPDVNCQSVTANSVTFEWTDLAGAAPQGYEASVNGATWFPTLLPNKYTVEKLGLNESVELFVRAKNAASCNGAAPKAGKATCKTLACEAPVLKIVSQTDESCFGAKDANITFSGSGTNLTYKVTTPQGEVQQNKTGKFNNLSAGKHKATLINAGGCLTTLEFDIIAPKPISTTPIVKEVTCNGSKNGSITFIVKGGTAPYSFTWSNGAKDSVIQNLPTGLYNVVIYDQKNCNIKQEVLLKDQANMSLTANVMPVKCYGEASGEIQLNVAGGEAPLAYKWSNQKTTQNINNLKSGTYVVTVTDKNGCIGSKAFSVQTPESPMMLTTTHSSTICYGEKGYANAFTTGGTPPYAFVWNTKDVGANLKEIEAGTYFVTATDSKGCVRSDSAKIITTEEIKVTATVTPASCFKGQDGAVKITALSNGSSNAPLSEFSYKWSVGFQIPEAINLKGGERYTVTITNRLGCVAVKSFAIPQPNEIGVNVTQSTDAKCAESYDGTATVVAIGGNAPYQYQWDTNVPQTTATATGLIAGSYQVYITDSKGCKTQTKVVISAPKKIKISFTPTNVACAEGATGKLETVVIGGLSPYRYEWSNGTTLPNAENLKAGQYKLTVTDKNTCVVVQEMKIAEPQPIRVIAETTDITCNSGRDGKIRIFAEGGTTPYKYSLDDRLYNGVSTIVGLKSAYYNVSVKDVRGCIATSTDVFLEEPEPIKMSLGKDTTIKYGDTIVLNLDSYYRRNQEFKKYNWQTDHFKSISCTDCEAPKIYPTNTGIYRLTVTNRDGCTATDDLRVSVNYAPVTEVPTGFSPNGDSQNDLLLIHGDSNIKIKYFYVYGRDGSKLYEAENFYVNDTKMGWDGTHRGQAMPVGTYIYGMEVEYPNGQMETLKGNTTLLR